MKIRRRIFAQFAGYNPECMRNCAYACLLGCGGDPVIFYLCYLGCTIVCAE